MKKMITMLAATLAMLILILDSGTALSGASEGVMLCLRSVIPSLFPFIFLSTIICSRSDILRLKVLQPICNGLGIPAGCESILILGVIGGYPIGAKCICQAYKDGCISENTAKRLLGFCNNAGPSFLFGMLASVFTKSSTLWFLWGIQIASALLVGLLLPGKGRHSEKLFRSKPVPVPQALTQSVRTVAGICGWVVLFRTLCSYLHKWVLSALNPAVGTLVIGLFELTNGCVELTKIPSESIRFLICSILLSGGGLCVFMQTASVTGDLGTGKYFPGKVLQVIFSAILAFLVSKFLFQ